MMTGGTPMTQENPQMAAAILRLVRIQTIGLRGLNAQIIYVDETSHF